MRSSWKLNDYISITKTRINFGQNKPPFDYAVIEYDTEELMIRFSKGVKADFKVHFSNGYYISCKSFIRSGLLPLGRYEKTADMSYKFKENK